MVYGLAGPFSMRRDSLNGSKELSGKSPLMVASIPWTSETGQQVPVFVNGGRIPGQHGGVKAGH